MSISNTNMFGFVSGEKSKIPLLGMNIDGKVFDGFCDLLVKFYFYNTNEHPLECFYKIPKNDKIFIHSLSVEKDGKTFQSKIMQKDKARDKYEDSIAKGNTSSLAEEDSNYFNFSIGNIGPNQSFILNVGIGMDLFFKDDFLTISLPCSSFQFEEPKFPLPKGTITGCTISFLIESSSEILQIRSTSHKINFNFLNTSKTQCKVTLEPQFYSQDIELVLETANRFLPRVLVEKMDSSDSKEDLAAMLTFYPEYSNSIPDSELIFLVDQSGSMMGDKMESVKETLSIFLRSIPERTSFNIVGFGSDFQSLFKKSMEYNDESLEAAQNYVNNMQADLGGTEILSPLMKYQFYSIFSNEKSLLPSGISEPPKKQRRIFILTDGEISNLNSVLSYIEKNLHHTRIFSFGIGVGASRSLITGLADKGKGFAEFIEENGDIAKIKVLKQLKRALKKDFSDVKIKWDGIEVIASEKNSQALFEGDCLKVTGLIKNVKTSNASVSVSGMLGLESVSYSAKIDISKTFPGNFIHKVAANNLIKYWESLGTHKDEIIELSLHYQIISKETSFIIEIPGENSNSQSMKLITISPIKKFNFLQKYYHKGAFFTSEEEENKFPVKRKREEKKLGAVKLLSRMGYLEKRESNKLKELEVSIRDEENLFSSEKLTQSEVNQIQLKKKIFDVVKERKFNESSSVLEEKKLLSLISLQRASGYWIFDQKLTDVTGVKREKLNEVKKLLPFSSEIDCEKIFATVLALFVLKSKFATEKDKWTLIFDKASNWLQNYHIDVQDNLKNVEDWLK